MIALVILVWLIIGSRVAVRWLNYLDGRYPPDTMDEAWQVIAVVGLVICFVGCVVGWPLYLPLLWWTKRMNP